MEKNQYDVEQVHALVVVSAKEHGKVFQLQNGSLETLSYTTEHPPEYSDNEGFFTQSSGGQQLGSGNVRETDDEHNLNVYIKAITEELSGLVTEHKPEVVFVLEPEHLKGLIAEHLVIKNNIPVEVLAYGNYVEKEPQTILDLVRATLTQTENPADPASVAGEKDAAEKRKILEVGEKVSGL
jgi:hypothetical protein